MLIQSLFVVKLETACIKLGRGLSTSLICPALEGSVNQKLLVLVYQSHSDCTVVANIVMPKIKEVIYYLFHLQELRALLQWYVYVRV